MQANLRTSGKRPDLSGRETLEHVRSKTEATKPVDIVYQICQVLMFRGSIFTLFQFHATCLYRSNKPQLLDLRLGRKIMQLKLPLRGSLSVSNCRHELLAKNNKKRVCGGDTHNPHPVTRQVAVSLIAAIPGL